MKITKIKEVTQYIHNTLKGIYPDNEINSLIELIYEKKVNLKKTDRLLDPDYKLAPSTILEIQKIVQQLENLVPVQYILGETMFYDLNLNVNKNVLIPRQETEELVDWIIREQHDSPKILDIGTGSGCIAIALAKFIPQASLYAIDYNKQTLDTARKNAEKNNVSIQFIEADILSEQPSLPDMDIIVSNPPYIMNSEKQFMHKNILDFEPSESLFVADFNSLIFYHKIADYAKKYLSTNGLLYFEINENKAEDIDALLREKGFHGITIQKDINGKARMIKAMQHG
ncbi:MAG: peptide chain release factor N(5)-glutamine methyltransferase [Bacteroidales bacterium]